MEKEAVVLELQLGAGVSFHRWRMRYAPMGWGISGDESGVRTASVVLEGTEVQIQTAIDALPEGVTLKERKRFTSATDE